ncbi:MAG: hypothetical protein ACOYKZ_05620 [Chlamydiia bacterium]
MIQLRSPLEQFIKAEPGQAAFLSLQVYNDGETPCQIAVDAEDFRISPEGEIELAAQLSEAEGAQSCCKWIQLPEEAEPLALHEERRLLIPIVVPEDAKEGSRWAMVYVWSREAKAERRGECEIFTHLRYGIQVVVDVGVRASEIELDISSPQVSPERLTWTVCNRSSWVVKPKAECMLVDSRGHDHGLHEMRSGKILPGQQRLFHLDCDVDEGQYTAVFLLDDPLGASLGVRDLISISAPAAALMQDPASDAHLPNALPVSATSGENCFSL